VVNVANVRNIAVAVDAFIWRCRGSNALSRRKKQQMQQKRQHFCAKICQSRVSQIHEALTDFKVRGD